MVEQRQVLRIEEGSAACKVLVVDDKEDNRILLSEMLSAIGFEVREVAGGMEAVAEFARWQPHLVLMDFRMDGMDGNEAVRQIRRSPGGGAVKIIMQTASATDDSRGEALAAGADDFLAKPFRQNELFEKIRLLVGVRYIYAAVEPAPASVRPPVLTREMLESLPAEFRGQLREGAIRSRHDYLLGLIAQNPGIDPEISALLRDSVARFDYEALF
jgi:CheY-like chemotaxis protein